MDCGFDFAIGAGRAHPPGTYRPPPPPVETAQYQAPAEYAAAPLDERPPASSGPGQVGRAGRSGAARATWTAVVTADRDYYEAVIREAGDDPSAPPFTFRPPPRAADPADHRAGAHRARSVSQGIVPEIDLGEPPADPGVSHTHAVLLANATAAGPWWIRIHQRHHRQRRRGPITVNVEVPLHDGDRIHVGVWTTITLRRG